MQVNRRDRQLFQQLQNELNPDLQNLEPPGVIIPFMVHTVLKIIVLALLLLKGVFATIFSDLVIYELIAIFVVVQFWCTKNYTGKRMLGVRWFFALDEYGTQKANDEYLSGTGSKLFWIMQLVYSGFPLMMVVLAIVQAPFLFINFQMVLVSLGILIGGGANLFFFYQASGASAAKQKEIKKKLGVDMLRRLGLASITSYA